MSEPIPHSQSLFETAQYLSEHAKSNFAKMPERTIAKVLNNAPPSVRQSLATQYKMAEHIHESGGRLAPFQEKDYDTYDRLPTTMKTTVDKLRTEELTTDLMARMGHEQPEQPPSMRDHIEFAMEQNHG